MNVMLLVPGDVDDERRRRRITRSPLGSALIATY